MKMQLQNGLGCKAPKYDTRDFKVCSKRAGIINFPEVFELSNLPRVKNQEMVNSCCAHAASSILEYHANGVKLSTNFLYGMERSVCGEEDEGMYLIDACKIAYDYGDMLEVDCPGNYEVPLVSDYTEKIAKDKGKMLRAKKYCIEGYYACDTIDDVKYALMNYGPVLACIYWAGKYNLVDNIVYFGDGKSITSEGGVSDDGGYHAVMIYGWNSIGWLIQNSWGEEFANKGRFILPYQYDIPEARVFVNNLPITEETKVCLVRKNTNKNWWVKFKNYLINKIHHLKN